jgi:hypothetical protein
VTGAAASRTSRLPAPVTWGIAFGVANAAAPLAFWWLEPTTVYALSVALIATIYIGFAVADGRPRVIAAESIVASVFIVIAAVAITATPWLAVVGLAGHGTKDMWQHRTQFVSTTRWWPPFCAAVDFVAAAIVAGLIVAGVELQ